MRDGMGGGALQRYGTTHCSRAVSIYATGERLTMRRLGCNRPKMAPLGTGCSEMDGMATQVVSTLWKSSDMCPALTPCLALSFSCHVPCSVLAAQNLGPKAYRSFLDETFLADRVTTIRQYLDSDPSIMKELPPPSLADRYGG